MVSWGVSRWGKAVEACCVDVGSGQVGFVTVRQFRWGNVWWGFVSCVNVWNLRLGGCGWVGLGHVMLGWSRDSEVRQLC